MTGHLAIRCPNGPMAELILRMNSDWGYRLSLLSGSCVFIKSLTCPVWTRLAHKVGRQKQLQIHKTKPTAAVTLRRADRYSSRLRTAAMSCHRLRFHIQSGTTACNFQRCRWRFGLRAKLQIRISARSIQYLVHRQL
jgi:hypothetical protein